MALSSFRLQRAIARSAPLLRHYRSFSAISTSSSPSIQHHISSLSEKNSLQNHIRQLLPSHLWIQSLTFRSSSASLSSARSFNDDDKISPDTILFEGCDYNHWLITMEFPKDPKPTPEEMVETYVQTLAKVVGSVEEAKKRMYACSTTTYTGFQAVMTEEMSEKFRGLPGVVFILPDSYIDPVNKEYGGDKYINGTIIPRPPPVQYGRSTGRYGDRNRNFDRPRYNRPPLQQGNPPYDQQGPMQGDGRNYGPQQSYPPQQNYSPPGQGERRDHMPIGGRDYNHQGPMQGDGRSYVPQQSYPPQQNYGPTGQGERRDHIPVANRDYTSGGRDGYQGDGRTYVPQQNYPPQQNYGPTGQGERRDHMPVANRDYTPGGRDGYQVERRDTMPSYNRNYNQGERANISQEQRDFQQGYPRDYAPPENRDFRGDNMSYPPSSGEGYRQGGSAYGQSYPGPGEGQRFSQVEQRNGTEGEQRNSVPMGQMGTDQV